MFSVWYLCHSLTENFITVGTTIVESFLAFILARQKF